VKAFSPTAVHSEGPKQDTAPSKATPVGRGFGLGTTDQALPFHDSINVWERAPPTVMHLDAAVHETPNREMPGRTGLGVIVHTDPFQDSINGSAAAPSTALPTAIQADRRVHDTPYRIFDWPLGKLGLGTTDQTDPFHDSIRVSSTGPEVVKLPTAVQALGPLHDTDWRIPF
jgi:hypothetical protein